MFSAPLSGSTLGAAFRRAAETLKIFHGLFHRCRRHCCLGFFEPGIRFDQAIEAFLLKPRSQRAPPMAPVDLTAASLQAAHAQWLRHLSRDQLGVCECAGKSKPQTVAAQTLADAHARVRSRKSGRRVNDSKDKDEAAEGGATNNTAQAQEEESRSAAAPTSASPAHMAKKSRGS